MLLFINMIKKLYEKITHMHIHFANIFYYITMKNNKSRN